MLGVLWGFVLVVLSLLDGSASGFAVTSVYLAGALTAVWWVMWKEPRVIIADDVGLTFVARSRSFRIPWTSLRYVLAPAFGRPRYLRWKVKGRQRRYVTFGGWVDFDRLVAMIEERAPDAKIWI